MLLNKCFFQMERSWARQKRKKGKEWGKFIYGRCRGVVRSVFFQLDDSNGPILQIKQFIDNFIEHFEA